MNKKVSKYYEGITDVYYLQCLCTELNDFCTKKDTKILILNHKCNIYLESLKSLRKDNENNQKEIFRLHNIINELEKWLEQEYVVVKANCIQEPNNPEWYIKWNERKNTLDKLQELKGSVYN